MGRTLCRRSMKFEQGSLMYRLQDHAIPPNHQYFNVLMHIKLLAQRLTIAVAQSMPLRVLARWGTRL